MDHPDFPHEIMYKNPNKLVSPEFKIKFLSCLNPKIYKDQNFFGKFQIEQNLFGFLNMIQHPDFPNILPIFWIPGIEDVTSSDVNKNKIKLLVENKQIAVNSDEEEQCNFDYKGEIILRKNNFGFLKTKVCIFILGYVCFNIWYNTVWWGTKLNVFVCRI